MIACEGTLFSCASLGMHARVIGWAHCWLCGLQTTTSVAICHSACVNEWYMYDLYMHVDVIHVMCQLQLSETILIMRMILNDEYIVKTT
jgi:hypothetical protein